MTEPFLILHKARGEPAFDIAEKVDCAECRNDSTDRTMCMECDGLGFWWIVQTSGHRAHPWWHIPLEKLMRLARTDLAIAEAIRQMPEGWPDHYKSRSSPKVDISTVLSAILPKMEVDRRF